MVIGTRTAMPTLSATLPEAKAMMSSHILLAMLVTVAALMFPIWGWSRMLGAALTQEDMTRQRRQAELLHRQQQREAVFAAFMPAPEPEVKEKTAKK